VHDEDIVETKRLLSSAGFQRNSIFSSVRDLLQEYRDLKYKMITLKLGLLVESWHKDNNDKICPMHEWLGSNYSIWESWVNQNISDEDYFNTLDLRAPGHVYVERSKPNED
jgi:hypothetical protein